MALHVIDRMAVEDEGQGAADAWPVICVHGLGGSSNTFTPLMPALQRQRVLRVDMPGSARSQRCEGPITISRLVDALVLLATRLNISRAHWVGHSLGTLVLQHLAVRGPKLVASLALFGPVLEPTQTMRQGLRARAAKARSEGLAGMHDIANTQVSVALSTDTRARQPQAVALVRESLMRQEPECYAASCEALADAQAAAVDGISAPVLLVSGDEDGIAPPQAVRSLAERLHASLAVRVAVLSRCGHWTPVERPDECQRELREFLAQRQHRVPQMSKP